MTLHIILCRCLFGLQIVKQVSEQLVSLTTSFSFHQTLKLHQKKKKKRSVKNITIKEPDMHMG